MTKYEAKVRKWIARDINSYFEFAVQSHEGTKKFNDPFMNSMLVLGNGIMNDIMHLHRIEFASTYTSLGEN